MPRVPRPDLLRPPAPPPPPVIDVHTVYGPGLPDVGAVVRDGVTAPETFPTHITWDNIGEWVNPRPVRHVAAKPATTAPAPAAAPGLGLALEGRRLAKSVLHDEDASRSAKKVARMLIDIIDTQDGLVARAEPETSDISLSNFRRRG